MITFGETHKISLTEIVCLRIVYAELMGMKAVIKPIGNRVISNTDSFCTSHSAVANNLYLYDKMDCYSQYIVQGYSDTKRINNI